MTFPKPKPNYTPPAEKTPIERFITERYRTAVWILYKWGCEYQAEQAAKEKQAEQAGSAELATPATVEGDVLDSTPKLSEPVPVTGSALPDWQHAKGRGVV